MQQIKNDILRKREAVKQKPIAHRPQGHSMDLFLKISVLQATFCWLGDLEEIVCPWKENLARK